MSAKEVSASLLKMVKVLQRAPENVRSIDCFKIICDTTRKAMGLSQEGDEQVIDDEEKMIEAMCNDEIDDPEWIDIMIELTKVAEETYILNDRNEFPTFTLIPEWDINQNDNAGSIPQVEKQNLNQDNEKEKEPEKKPEQEKEQETEKEAEKEAEKEKEPEKEQQKEQEMEAEKEAEKEQGKETEKEAEKDGEEEYQVTLK